MRKYKVEFTTIVEHVTVDNVSDAIAEAMMQLRDLATAPVNSQVTDWQFKMPDNSLAIKVTAL